MTTFVNSSRHAIDAGTGTMIGPGETFELDADEAPAWAQPWAVAIEEPKQTTRAKKKEEAS